MHCLRAVILAVYGVVTAYTWCTKEDADIMVRQWSQAFGMGGNGNKEAAIQGGSGFFIQLMRDEPVMKGLFVNVSGDNTASPVFRAHALRVITGLDLCVNALVDIPVLKKITSHLAEQHGSRIGLQSRYFDMHLKASGDGLAMLVDNFNMDAWYNCMGPVFRSLTSRLP